jgi:septal ring factor EnvC (AmiA/AmiB activator)
MPEARRGAAAQPELYLEMRKGSEAVDPAQWFGKAAPKG